MSAADNWKISIVLAASLRGRMMRGMKIPGILAGVAVAAAVGGLVLAQETTEKKRMVFPADGSQPVVATPTPPSTPPSEPRAPQTPAEAVMMFFRALAAGEVDGAYDRLVRDTTIAERPQDVAALKERTRQALDVCGPFADYEVLEEKSAGRHLARWTCLSLHTDLPLRWRFYFYLSEGRWRLVDLRVDDGLVELFEDGGRPGR